MNERGSERHSIDEILAAARARLDRIDPQALEHERANGALIVDILSVDQRMRDGELPGAIVIDCNVLEWRLDPDSAHHLAQMGCDTRIVVVCSEGYSSSLAAAQLQDLGLHRATDLIGAFQAWLRLTDTE